MQSRCHMWVVGNGLHNVFVEPTNNDQTKRRVHFISYQEVKSSLGLGNQPISKTSPDLAAF